jgi:hypothetical protein
MWEWPAERFEHMFELHLLRRHRELLRAHRDRMIAAVYANPNYDGAEGKDARMTMLDEIGSSYDEAVEILYGGRSADNADQEQEMANDPLFAPVMRQIAADSGQIAYEGAGEGAAILR